MKTTERIRATLLNICAVPGMGDLQLLRFHVINGFVFLGIVAIIVYVAIFTITGTTNSITGVLKKRHATARVVAIYITLFILFFIALTDRRTGLRTQFLNLTMKVNKSVITQI